VALDALPGGPYRFDLATQAVEPSDAKSGGRRYSVGDPVRVEIAGADEELARVDLRIVAAAG
jgi:ribonuclease R